MAARSASRGGSSRMAANRHGAGCAALACQAARPVPVPRQTSQARAIRWLSVGRRRAAVAGSASARRACSAAGPICFSRARASARAAGPGSGISARPSVSEAKYRPLPPVRIGSRPASRARVHFGQRRVAPPGDAARFRGGTDAVERMRDPGLVLRRWTRRQHTQFAINLHRVGVDDRAAQPFGDFQRQRRFPAGGRAGDDQGEGGHGGRRPKSRVVAPLGIGFLLRAAFRRFRDRPYAVHVARDRRAGKRERWKPLGRTVHCMFYRQNLVARQGKTGVRPHRC